MTIRGVRVARNTTDNSDIELYPLASAHFFTLAHRALFNLMDRPNMRGLPR
jgi:hypothetical protein